MSELIAHQDGVYKPLDQVSIALNDAGFVFGATVTGQCRTYRQVLFQFQEHYTNFANSCSACALPQWSAYEIETISKTLVQENRRQVGKQVEWTVVWVATPGRIGSFLGLPGGLEEAKPQLIVYCFPLPFARFRPLYIEGAEVWVPTRTRQPTPDSLPRNAKHRSRLHWWLAWEEIQEIYPASAAAQALLLDDQLWNEGREAVTETASANFLMVRQGEVLSPGPARIYYGNSLAVTLQLCDRLGISSSWANLSRADLATADEAILCSTPYGIAPVGNLNGRRLPVRGPVFERLLAAWNDLVGLDMRAQFLQSDL